MINLYKTYLDLNLLITLTLLSYLTLYTFHSHAKERVQAKDIVAIQLRAQGIPCTAPSTAQKDVADSRPDVMAWVISCKEAKYRVTLIPHIGAIVDVIDPSESTPNITETKE